MGYANDYLKEDLFISFGKLFTNAISYLLDDRISAVDVGAYAVKGSTDEHLVLYTPMNGWSCDCPLSNGKEPYDEPMECSHIQSVRLYRIELS